MSGEQRAEVGSRRLEAGAPEMVFCGTYNCKMAAAACAARHSNSVRGVARSWNDRSRAGADDYNCRECPDGKARALSLGAIGIKEYKAGLRAVKNQAWDIKGHSPSVLKTKTEDKKEASEMVENETKNGNGNGTKNKLMDLNNHLFAQLERLTDETIVGEKLDTEIKRAKAVSGLAQHIIGNARLALDAQVAVNDGLIKTPPLMLGARGYEEA